MNKLKEKTINILESMNQDLDGWNMKLRNYGANILMKKQDFNEKAVTSPWYKFWKWGIWK